MPVFDVNSDKSINFAAKLETLHKSAFPSAVRNTLNKAALDMKETGLLISAKQNFTTIRSPTFFKKFTLFNKASGFNVNEMESVVGFSNPGDLGVRKVIDGFRKHEFGGIIATGARYLKDSRVGGNYGKRVRIQNYYDKSKVITGRSSKKGNRKSKFVARMFRAKKENKAMFLNAYKGNVLVKVTSIRKNKSTGKITSKLKFLMQDRKKSPVRIKRNRFISDAANFQHLNMDKYFKDNAEFQFKKHLKV